MGKIWEKSFIVERALLEHFVEHHLGYKGVFILRVGRQRDDAEGGSLQRF